MERKRKIVKVTRRGQTTIPVEFRRRHRIEEGTKLMMEDRGDALIVRPLARIEEFAGFLSENTTVERLTRLLAESREDEE